MKEIKRIIIIDLLYLGDMLFAHPFFAGLRKIFPFARIDLVANSNFAEIMRINNNLDHVYSYSKNYSIAKSYKFAKKLEKNNYQLGINIHGNWRTALLLKLISPQKSIGFGGKGRGVFLDQEVERKNGHMVDQYLDFLEEIAASSLLKDSIEAEKANIDIAEDLDETSFNSVEGNKIDKPEIIFEEKQPVLELTSEYLNSAERILENSGLKADDHFIVLNTGGSWETKRWPKEYFAELAERLRESGKRVLFVGGPSDCERVEEILNMMNTNVEVYNICGKTSLLDLAGVLDYADLIISGDTGPVHVGAAVGTDTLTLFGPSDEKKYHPRGRGKNIVLKNDSLECRPCGEHKCPLEHHKCLRDITAEMIMNELNKRSFL